MIFSLLVATVLRIFLVLISYGCKVPAGIFVPSMAIGASFGRMVGILVQALHETYPNSQLFAACEPDVPCITPGTYAFLGAAAALSGIMHITVSVVVIMFELTGALTYILPTMIVVGITKAVSDRFGRGGIADRMIWFNGMPFLDNKEEHSFGVPVSQVMTTAVKALPARGATLAEIEHTLHDTSVQGFPIVETLASRTLVGFIGRTELRYAVDRARRASFLPPDATLLFTTDADDAAPPGPAALDLTRLTNATPLTVHPRLPLETVLDIFKKLGPRAILVERHGALEGLVTVKDCLKYQFTAHAAAAAGDEAEARQDERVWGWMRRAALWVKWRVGQATGGRVVLREPGGEGGVLWVRGVREAGRGVELDEVGPAGEREGRLGRASG